MSHRFVAGAPAPPAAPYDADIIILALDRTEETLAAIASAGAQIGVSKHIFVLDQGSSPAALDRLAHAVEDQPDITLFAASENLGVAGGRNLLSSLGRGRIIAALDNDAEFACTATLAHLAAALQAEPDLAAVACRIVTHADGTDDLSSWGYPSNLLPLAGETFEAVTFVGAGHAIRRDAWRQAGGYDPRLFFCWEEFDFCLRAIVLGWRICYRGDIVIRHKVSPERRVGWGDDRWFYFVRNRIYIERKLDRAWLSLSPRIAGYILKGIRNGLPIQTLGAIRAAARMSPRSTRAMPRAARSYLIRNDRLHRASFLRRFVREVCGRVGIAAAPTGR